MHPTLYPEINVVLHRLLTDVQAILGDHFFGLYLHGSLATGDFNPDTSDIDFIVTTTDEIRGAKFTALEAMHAQVAASDSKWAKELEGSYIPLHALRRHDPAHAIHPRIERGGHLRLEQHNSDWVIQRYILREHGVAVVGPDLEPLIDPIRPADLQRAVLDILWWWKNQLEDTSLVQQSGHQAYAILSMNRVLYTLQFGQIVSKPEAARWALEILDERWVRLIIHALAWRPDEQLNQLSETLAFIRYTLHRARQFEQRIDQG